MWLSFQCFKIVSAYGKLGLLIALIVRLQASMISATYMPKVTVEMLDWWFPWHSVGSDLRYKIWDPEDHYFARADRVDYVCDPNVPMREKTWGVSHYIMEDVGPGPEFLKLNFKRPKDFG